LYSYCFHFYIPYSDTAEEAAEWGKTIYFPTVWTALLKLADQDKNGENAGAPPFSG
jgi:hypothetical protein